MVLATKFSEQTDKIFLDFKLFIGRQTNAWLIKTKIAAYAFAGFFAAVIHSCDENIGVLYAAAAG
jgi:hypothetical protein